MKLLIHYFQLTGMQKQIKENDLEFHIFRVECRNSYYYDSKKSNSKAVKQWSREKNERQNANQFLDNTL